MMVTAEVKTSKLKTRLYSFTCRSLASGSTDLLDLKRLGFSRALRLFVVILLEMTRGTLILRHYRSHWMGLVV